MPLVRKPVELGRLRGTLYTFECIGDTLEMHFHDESTVHVTFILRGQDDRAQMYCTNALALPAREEAGEWERTGFGGEFWDFDAGSHEFTALAAGARIINIIKG